MIKIFGHAIAISFTVVVSSFAQITFDGTITEPAWGSPVATQAGGPGPGFGAGHEINALYVTGDTSNIDFGIAGNVQDGNRIMLFIDSKAGGYNTGNFGRDSAPQGIDDFNSGSMFDAGFFADYVLVIGTNPTHDNFFFDLYTLSGTAGSGGGPSTFLGTPNGTTIGANPANSSNTQGFELAIAKSALGYTGGNIQLFAAYTSDGGFLSNQFLTHAGSGETNYGSGPVDFSAAAPNPITVSSTQLVPEPSTLSLLAGPVLLGTWFYARRRRRS